MLLFVSRNCLPHIIPRKTLLHIHRVHKPACSLKSFPCNIEFKLSWLHTHGLYLLPPNATHTVSTQVSVDNKGRGVEWKMWRERKWKQKSIWAWLQMGSYSYLFGFFHFVIELNSVSFWLDLPWAYPLPTACWWATSA